MTTHPVQAIDWRPDFATGVAIMDDQHKMLVKMINDASAQLTDSSPLKDYDTIIRGLLNYADRDLQYEERLMHTYGYDRLPKGLDHIKQHKEFRGKMVAFQEHLKAGKPILKHDLVLYLTGWLTYHILHFDKELVAFVRNKMTLMKGAGGKA